MNVKSSIVALALVALGLPAGPMMAQEKAEPEKTEATVAPKPELRPEDKLVVLWTSGDRDVALKMVFMYTVNSPRFGWWEDITFIVWGPSAKLLSEDEELQAQVKLMQEAGIHLEACKACADQYGVSEKLGELGVDVKYMGNVLTDYVKEGRHVLTF